MKIVFISRYNPFTTNAGVEIFIGRLSKFLSEKNHDITIFCGRSSKAPNAKIRINEIRDGFLPVFRTPQFNLLLKKSLIDFLHKESVDVIGCHGAGPAAAFCSLIDMRNHFPRNDLFIYHAHDCIASEFSSIRPNMGFNPLLKFRYNYLINNEKNACDKSDLIIAQSIATKEALISEYQIDPSKIEIIPVGIPDDYANGIIPINNSEYCFVTMGAGCRRDIKVFLHALAILRDYYNLHAKGIILRDKNPDHLKIANNLQIDVDFLFNVPTLKLKYIFSSCTAFVLPSLREGFGLPVIESAAFGKPSIVSKVGSLPEIVENMKTGLILNNLTSYDLAKSMHWLIVNSKKRIEMGLAAKKESVNYSMSSISEKFLSLLQNYVE